MKPNLPDCNKLYDLLIIGGGINGTAIAADAAGRGLSVLLCEKNDLASGTSSASSKLIHGGLRYLEYLEFRLVREALQEREILLQKAPHLIQPVQFIMPYVNQIRPAWLIRLGLFIYDHLAQRKKLTKATAINLQQHPAGKLLKSEFKHAFSYSDCLVDDARLVVSNALAAKKQGAHILTRTQFISGQRKHEFWNVQLQNSNNASMQQYQARILINAAGPWADQILSQTQIPTNNIKLVKGSHIVVSKFTPYAFVLQHTDKRIIFVEPFLDQYNLIGTTEIEFTGNPDQCEISPEEINYLCQVSNQYFKNNIAPADVIWSYSGLRPLKNEIDKTATATTRDYSFALNLDSQGKLPFLSVLGGKITTHRRLAEHALQLLRPYLPHCKNTWTAHSFLPGGDILDGNLEMFITSLQQQYTWLAPDIIRRYAKNYGTLTYDLLKDAKNIKDLGKYFAAGLYEREIQYLITHEWAQSSDDILWRRSKLGLQFSLENKIELEKTLASYL
jgi:glycerol-3-phosphate dehydrogenase